MVVVVVVVYCLRLLSTLLTYNNDTCINFSLFPVKVEMEKVVGKRCPMCNNQKGMGAPPKPKPKVVFGKREIELSSKGYISELSSGSISKRTIRERKCLRYMKER